MIKKAIFYVTCSYILGLPNEDEEMVKNTIRFAKELCTPQAKFFLPVPYPGTKLFEECKTTGGLREDASWDDYLAIDFDNPVYVNPKIGVEKMKYFYAFAWRHYYFSPKIWLENIKQLKSVDDFRRYARGTKALLYFFVNIFEKLFIYFRKSRHVKTCTE